MKRLFSLLLTIVMILSLVPTISADELRQGNFDVASTLNKGSGTVYVKLSPPMETIVLSAVEMEVILPAGFSGGNPIAAVKGWTMVPVRNYITGGRNAIKIALYSTKNAITTAKDTSVTLVNIPVTFSTKLKAGDYKVDIKVTDIAIDIKVGGKTQTVSGLDYFEAKGSGDSRVYEYSESIKYNKDISSATISGIVDKNYTGGKIKQYPKVVLDGNVLVESTDYQLSYEKNVDCGVATIIIMGKGGYKGQIRKNFYIIPQSIYDISCSNPTINSAKISWVTSKNVDGYYILRSTSETSGFEIIKTSRR